MDWTMIVAGYYHTLALKNNGTLWAWGNNANGQLGDGTTLPKYSPTQTGTDTDWAEIIAGGYHSFGLKIGGTGLGEK